MTLRIYSLCCYTCDVIGERESGGHLSAENVREFAQAHRGHLCAFKARTPEGREFFCSGLPTIDDDHVKRQSKRQSKRQ